MLSTKTEKRLQRKLWRIVQGSENDDDEQVCKQLAAFQTRFDDQQQFHRILISRHQPSGDSICHVIARHDRLVVLRRHEEELRTMLRVGNGEGKEPLHDAAATGSLRVARHLIRSDVTEVNALKRNGWTPLMMAATCAENLPMLELLVEEGNAVVSLRNKDGWDAFHIACRSGDVSMAKYLHSRHPDSVRAVSNNGRTPLHTAALHARNPVIKFLLATRQIPLTVEDNCGSVPAMEAVCSGDLTTISLLHTPQTIHHRDKAGYSCLHAASENGRVDALRHLVNELAYGVDSPTTDGNSHTALHLAYFANQPECVRVLVDELGADTQLCDAKSRLPHQMTSKKSWKFNND